MSSHNDQLSKGHRTERFLRLLTPIQGHVFAYILSRWPNKTDADDIMQETIATIWNKFDEYQSGTDFQAWAVTIAKYTVMNFRRKNHRNPIQFNNEVWQVLESKSDDYLKKFDNRISILKECVKKLNERDKKLIELRYLHELPVKQIAGRFDVTSRAIYKTFARIYNILMRCLHRSIQERALYE